VLYMHVSLIILHKNRAVPISAEQKKNESTTKGSDRILEAKTPLNIVDPKHPTRHAAEALGSIRRSTYWAI